MRSTYSSFRYYCVLNILGQMRTKLQAKLIKKHTAKLSRLLDIPNDIDKHIKNLSSYRLNFFEKLVLSRGLQFSLPRRATEKDNIQIIAGFEKLYRQIEKHLPDEKKDITITTLKSIALNYSKIQGPSPPRSLLKAVASLKRKNDIIVTKPDKGNGVVILDKSEYIRLLKASSIELRDKFAPYIPKSRRGPKPRHSHPIFYKEKEVTKLLNKILPEKTAEKLRPLGSRLPHLYGLPKTHKTPLEMRPILSAVNSYNYNLAKWLNELLKPLSTNEYTVKDIFNFADELRSPDLDLNNHILVSYDVKSLFTCIPLDETIHILVEKAFKNNWFNDTYGLKLSEKDLTELLSICTKDQLFQFEGELYEQTDGVAMGSPLGPLLANVFMCDIERQLEERGKLPTFYRRYVDDTISALGDHFKAMDLLTELNSIHPSLSFTMEIEVNNELSFLGVLFRNKEGSISTSVYRKSTNTGLLLHYQSHVDFKYKSGLLKTMLNRAVRLSSSETIFNHECTRLRNIFNQLHYPVSLFNRILAKFNFNSFNSNHLTSPNNDTAFNVILPFKDQRPSNVVKQDLSRLSNNIGITIRPIFTSRKLIDELRHKETKPEILSKQSVVYHFKCGQCDADYVGYTRRHLHQRIYDHRSSTIGDHLRNVHNFDVKNDDISQFFHVLCRGSNKFDCLVKEMVFISKLKPKLNTQKDSLKSLLFR